MSGRLGKNFQLLINAISAIETVDSIGKSGGKALPESNESDIDVFIFCSSTPAKDIRKAAIDSLGELVTSSRFGDAEGRFWGTIDFITMNDTEICLMYFTMEKTNAEINTILSGERIMREDEYFYPTGRCASILSMCILFDKDGYISGLKDRVSFFPAELAKKLIAYHVKKINDEEDFERSVSRKDVLFYHATLENAMDHYLQALFALNRTFFPSRKRSIQFINEFAVKPVDCANRILKTVKLGADYETLTQSYNIWSALCNDLTDEIDRAVLA